MSPEKRLEETIRRLVIAENRANRMGMEILNNIFDKINGTDIWTEFEEVEKLFKQAKNILKDFEYELHCIIHEGYSENAVSMTVDCSPPIIKVEFGTDVKALKMMVLLKVIDSFRVVLNQKIQSNIAKI